jgi:hypothetical protein
MVDGWVEGEGFWIWSDVDVRGSWRERLREEEREDVGEISLETV